MFTLADGIEALTHTRPAAANWPVTAAVVDSRQAVPGAMFIALPGEHADGHDYIADAFQRGASLALVQRDLPIHLPVVDLRQGALPEGFVFPAFPFCLRVSDSLIALQNMARFWRSRLSVRVTGITGSVGKSTTKELVAQVLSQRYRTLKSLGNLNNEIGLPITLLRLQEGDEEAVLEMGFYLPGEIRFLCELAHPVVGVITNIGTVHAERAGTQDVIAAGKSELVEMLPPDGVAILNMDDPWVRPMAAKTRARVFFYGLQSEADLWADQIIGDGLEGIHFRLHYRHEVLHLRVPLIGRHSVHTALRAAAVGLVEGLSWDEILTGLREGRTQLHLAVVHSRAGALVLDDTYNASPESTMAALNLLDDLGGHKVAVLGDMLELGPYEAQGHEMVGIRAAEVVHELVTVGSRARLIAQAARQAGLSEIAIHSFDEIEAALNYLNLQLAAGDVVLVKGSRGMRMERITAALEANA